MGQNDLRRHLLGHLLFLLAIITTKAYEDSICDEPNPRIFCSCDTKHLATSISCFITGQAELNSHDEIWQSLAGVENLVHLKLNSMGQQLRLDYIPTDSLQQMMSLRTFSVQLANLGVLKTNSVSNLMELRELQLVGNDITRLEEGAIANLPNLKKLELSENLLQELLAESFTGVENLEKLYLDRNNISRIEGYAFSNLHSLRELDLFGNSITDLTEYMFVGLRYLRTLELYKNKIRILNDKVFQAMPKLVEIDMNHNLISHVAPKAFFGLPNLQKLVLTWNKIKTLPDVVFKSLPTLRNIELYNNKLETLQVEILENMANVKDVHFSLSFKENPLKCDCRLHWVKTYIHLNKSHHLTRELHDLRCRPDGEKNLTLVVHLLQIEPCPRSEDPFGTTVDHHVPVTIKNHATGTTKDHASGTTKDHVPRTTKDHVPAAIEKASSLVPYGIQSERRNMTRNRPVEMPEIQDAEAIHDDDDDEDNDMGNAMGSPSGCMALVGDAKLVLLVTLVSGFLVRKRKGTPWL